MDTEVFGSMVRFILEDAGFSLSSRKARTLWTIVQVAVGLSPVVMRASNPVVALVVSGFLGHLKQVQASNRAVEKEWLSALRKHLSQ